MRKHLLIMAGMAVLVAGCGETKLLSGRNTPDETRVVDGPSLALPPDFDLRPPTKSEDYEAVLRAQKTVEARNLITGVSGTVVEGVPTTSVNAVATPSVGEPNWLTDQAGTARGDIREQLEREAAQEKEAEKDSGFWNKIMGKKSE